MPFQIVRDDIVRMRVDAIVNAANEHLRHGGGVCGAIFDAAGPRQLQAACDEIGHCSTGGAVATPAFALNARHVIHAVGPVWQGGTHGEEAALRSCYRASLALAQELGDKSIAFPLISSGIYGYPKDAAIDVAISEIRSFLDRHDMDVYLIIFDQAALRAASGRFGVITQYINDRYAQRSPYRRRAGWELRSAERGLSTQELEACNDLPDWDTSADWDTPAGMAAPSAPAAPMPDAAPAPSAPMRSAAPAAAGPARPKRHGLGARGKEALERLLGRLDASFSTTLLHMIDERGLRDSEVYKRANLSRQHFSKIRGNPSYRPKKQTVLALAIALELTLDETRLLLERAGFALTHADERDVIVEYYINRGMYDIYEINLALYAFDQPLLG